MGTVCLNLLVSMQCAGKRTVIAGGRAVPIADLDRAGGNQADTAGAVLNGRGPLNACFNVIKVDSSQKYVKFR